MNVQTFDFMLKVAWGEDRRALKGELPFLLSLFLILFILDSSNIALYRVFHTCCWALYFWLFSDIFLFKETYLLLNVRYKRCFLSTLMKTLFYFTQLERNWPKEVPCATQYIKLLFISSDFMKINLKKENLSCS